MGGDVHPSSSLKGVGGGSVWTRGMGGGGALGAGS